MMVIILLMIGAFFDYDIATYMYHPTSLIGIFFERIMLIFVIFLIPFCFYGLYRIHKLKLYFVAYLVGIAYWVLDAAHYWISISSYWYVLLPLVLMMMFLSYFILKHIPIFFFQRYERFFRFVLLVFLNAMAITILWKTLWGRVRYREMLDNASLFTAWYVPQGISGHTSFPSGHTTAMCSILCFFELHRATSYKMSRNRILCGCIVFLIIMMMLSRMIMGAHFLSDVSMGFGVTYTMYLFWKRRIE